MSQFSVPDVSYTIGGGGKYFFLNMGTENKLHMTWGGQTIHIFYVVEENYFISKEDKEYQGT